MEIKTYDLGYCDESLYTRVVCVSRYKDKFVFSYNKKRNGFEIPGGHIEEGESWLAAAEREMYEETGATKINVEPICVYKISTFALLCYCEILDIGEIPEDSEIERIIFSDELPDNLTFPEAYKLYFDIVRDKKGL